MRRRKDDNTPAMFVEGYGGTWQTPEPAKPIGSDAGRTSRAAHRTKRNADRDKLLAYVAGCGSRGTTCEEATIALGLRTSTGSARFSELRKAGKIIDAGRTRPTTSGRAAVVWLASGGGGDE
jgi:hypothetical protein